MLKSKKQATAAAKLLLKDLCPLEWVITRELLIIGVKTEWKPQNRELREFAFSLFGGTGSTKQPLESAFNWLKDSCQRQGKTSKMSPWTKWLYLLVNPYVREGGVDQLLPSTTDFMTLIKEKFDDKTILNLHPFKPLKSTLGKEFPRPKEKAVFIRPAGFYSNRVAAAASALVLFSAPNFAIVEDAWCGPLLAKGRS